MKNADMPAMPQERALWVEGIGECPTLAIGLTKREYFAGLAMQAWINHHGASGGYSFNHKDAAKSAIECADALLTALENQNDPT